MQIFIVVSLLIAIVAVVFALQNMAAVTVSFLFWNFDSSLALVLLGTLAVGVLISLLASMPGSIRSKLAASNQKKKLSALETERDGYKKRAEDSEKDVHDLELQLASLSAELDKYMPDETSKPS
ncbi:MAG: LapA family protein [Anaerolineaceae bacterium]